MSGIPWPKIEPPHPDAVDHFVTAMTGPAMKMYLAYGDDGREFYVGPAGLEAYGTDILNPPHRVDLPPQPEPEPLTEEDLAGFERYCATTELPPYIEDDIIPALIAEVRRLRADLIEERAYHLMFEDVSVLSWADVSEEHKTYWREQAARSLHVATADLHAWIYDPDR